MLNDLIIETLKISYVYLNLGEAIGMDYFSGIQKIELQSLIKDAHKIYAHISVDKRSETLQKHNSLCIKYLKKIIKKKQLENVLMNVEEKLLGNMSEDGKLLYRDMMYHTIYLHDVGKINCNFQSIKMKNQYFKDFYNIDCNNSNHSMLSSIIYMNEYFDKLRMIKIDDEKKILCIILLFNSYIISKHHGDFDSFSEYRKKLVEADGEGKRLYTEQSMLFVLNYAKKIFSMNPNAYLQNIFKVVEQRISELYDSSEEMAIDFYIYKRIVSSLLLACDYYATTEFKHDIEVNELGEINEIDKFYSLFAKSKIYQGIRAYETKSYNKNNNSFRNITDINILRNELFLDAEKNLLSNLNRNIYYLEAPTGSGKSMVSLNLSFKLVEHANNINKIFYVYPFNTLIEQNIESFGKIFGNTEEMNNIAVINSLVPIKKSSKLRNKTEDGDVINDNNIDYTKSLLDRQFLHYPIVLTTHVSMFRFLFGTNKEDLFPLSQIANSVLIFDEIQSYKNNIWKEIITFLNHYSEMLNIKVIIMSATLPNLSKLVGTKIDTVNLISNKEKYFLNPIFKNRVKLNFELLDITSEVLDNVIYHVAESAKQENINILMEFIYRSSANEAYNKLCEMDINNKEIMLLTSESSVYERKEIVKAFKERKNIILVSTQVIEAGVDLDSNIGYKDISLLDSEEQFIGRINRHFINDKEVGQVFFFNLDSAAELYRGDVRKESMLTLLNKEIRDILINKDFDAYYNKILDYLLKRVNNAGGFNEFMNNSVNKQKYKEIEERMNLIDDQYQFSIFLSRDIYINDLVILHGDEVWETYIGLLDDKKMDYAEKKIKLQEASIHLNYFIYKTRKNDFPYEKHIGDLYYISDCDKYFENGRFVRKNFDNDIFT